jgi:hypothetical protein
MKPPEKPNAPIGGRGAGKDEDNSGHRECSDEDSETQATSYVASTIKRSRRTKAEIGTIKAAIYDLLAADHPQTVRQVFYALTVQGVIRKAEIEYQRTVCRLLTEMREARKIPFGWIADNTRWMRKPETFTGLGSCLRQTAKFYRRNLWHSMPTYVEVWSEKDALAGVILEETDPYDVPLMVARGYASISFLHGAAETITAKRKPTYIYHFGDLDPSGVDAARDIETKLKRYAPKAEIHFERVAVMREQVEEWGGVPPENLYWVAASSGKPLSEVDRAALGLRGFTEIEALPPNVTSPGEPPADFHHGPTPGALQGDDYPLTYDENGYPELPACLDRRRPRLKKEAA